MKKVDQQFSIEQFPKFRKDSDRTLSSDQVIIRSKKKVKRYKYGQSKTCTKCGQEQSINEFYIRDRRTGRRNNQCRDCCLKRMGVKEVGAMRFANHLFKKGFRRCSLCKNIQPISQFTISKLEFGGRTHSCKTCVKQLNLEYRASHPRRKKRVPKYFIDGQSFVTLNDFARYMNITYGISTSAVIHRITKGGYSEEECKQSEKAIRSAAITKAKRATKTVPLYSLDGKEFFTLCDFTDYLQTTYNLNPNTTAMRIRKGYTEVECLQPDLRRHPKPRPKKDRPAKYFLDNIGFGTAVAFGNYVEQTYGIKSTTIVRRITGGMNEMECLYQAITKRNRNK